MLGELGGGELKARSAWQHTAHLVIVTPQPSCRCCSCLVTAPGASSPCRSAAPMLAMMAVLPATTAVSSMKQQSAVFSNAAGRCLVGPSVSRFAGGIITCVPLCCCLSHACRHGCQQGVYSGLLHKQQLACSGWTPGCSPCCPLACWYCETDITKPIPNNKYQHTCIPG